MPITLRDGTKLENKVEYYGDFAHHNSTLPGQKKKNKSVVSTRNQVAKQPKPPTFTLPTTPPAPQPTRILRQKEKKPICSLYGSSRETMYPGFHFCSPCRMFDNDMGHPHMNKKISRNSRSYKCTAKHTCHAYPTQTKEMYLSKKSGNGKRSSSHGSKPKKKRRVRSAPFSRMKRCNDDFESIPTVLDHAFAIDEDAEAIDKDEEILNKDAEILLLHSEIDTLKEQNRFVGIEMDTMLEVIRKHENDHRILTEQYQKLWADRDELVHGTIVLEHDKNNEVLVREQLENQIQQIENHHSNQLNELKKKIYKANRTLKYQTNTKLTFMKQHRNQNINNLASASEVINLFVANLVRLGKSKNRNQNKLSKLVVAAIWDADLLKGTLVDVIIEKAKDYIRNNIFSPSNILRAMDMWGGKLSMSSIELLRQMENQVCETKKTILPSAGAIKNVCRKVDEYSQKIVPFQEGLTPNGAEFAEFSPADVVNLMTKAFSLQETSQMRKIKINMAIDGAQLTSRTHHCTLGLKMMDKAAVDPLTGNLLYASCDKTTIQSKNNCFPIKIIFQRETKEILEEFRTAIDSVKELTNPDKANTLLKCLPIETAMDSDLSATWKLLAKGGAAKRNKFPCHMCAIADKDLEFPNPTQCGGWCADLHSNDPSFKCYHTDFLDDKTIDKLRSSLNSWSEELKFLIPELKIICSRSFINCNEDPRKHSTKDQLVDHESIHFDYEHDDVLEEEREAYGLNVTNDLMLRKLSIAGTIEQRIARLRNRLVQEFIYKSIDTAIVHSGKGKDTAFLLMTDCVPCILHMENRTGLKLLTLILQAGLQNITTDFIYTDIASIPLRMERLIEDVEKVFNTKIFGSTERVTQWHLPFNVKEKKFDDITMDNNRTRLTMANCRDIIDICIATDERKAEWYSIIDKYNIVIKCLRNKEDFTDEQINHFQLLVDDFYQLYMEVNGRPGVTNYFHMLGSGHVSNFLLYYRNLYVHSQQGWEAFNSYIKVFYFRRTSRGGGQGDFNRVRQIARWLSRRLVWMSGTQYDTMIQDIQSSDSMQIPTSQDTDDDSQDDISISNSSSSDTEAEHYDELQTTFHL